MNAKNVNEVLDALAARLSVPAAHLWAVLMRQAYVEFAVAVVAFASAATLFFICFRKYQAEQKAGKYGDTWGMPCFMVAILTAISFVIVLVTIGGALNPEYYALHEVLSVLK